MIIRFSIIVLLALAFWAADSNGQPGKTAEPAEIANTYTYTEADGITAYNHTSVYMGRSSKVYLADY